MSKKRVAVYIDGFNYYYAIVDFMHNDLASRQVKWLDYRALIEQKILKGVAYDKTNLKINFYTAINGYRSKESVQNHNTYINALRARNIDIIKGFYKLRSTGLVCRIECETCQKPVTVKNFFIDKNTPVICESCNNTICLTSKKTLMHPEEKQTDINIAKDILIDAIQDNYDEFYLFSTDSDFVPIADFVIKNCKKNFIVVAPDNKCLRRMPDNTQKFTFRYEINKFLDLGAEEYRIKMGRLTNYQLPRNLGNITKPVKW